MTQFEKGKATMINIIAVLILTALAVTATLAVYKVRLKISRYQEMWPQRELIAQVAFEIESDENAPLLAKAFANFMADHAFDDSYQAKILKDAYKGSAAPRLTPKKSMDGAFGKKYGEQLSKASIAFTKLCFSANPNVGRLLVARHKRREGDKRATKDIRNRQVRQLIKRFDEECHGGGAFGGGGNHTVAKAA